MAIQAGQRLQDWLENNAVHMRKKQQTHHVQF